MNLTDIDQRIRAGHSHQARAKLQEIVRRRHQSMIDRESLPQLASLCRRSGWPEGGLLLLNPIVRPPAKVKRLAQSKEIAEYAQSLISIGLVQEGRDLIATSTKDSPELMMAEAMSYFSAWDYSAAIPSLTRYVQTPGLSSYARLIGEVNLGAALVIVRDPEAPAQLSRLREECRRSGHSLLLGNLFEITAQWHYWQGGWDAAEQALEQSDRLLSQHVNIDKLSLEKWKVILRMRRSGATRALTQQLHSIVARALDLRHWETSRDCDFHLAVIREDRRLATAVYFGTPYVAFRQRLATHFGPSWPEEFGRNMGEPSRRPSRSVSLRF